MQNSACAAMVQPHPTSSNLSDLLFQEKRFIDSLINKYRSRNKYRVSADDIQSLASETLWKCTKSFNPDLGIPFEHYVHRAISNRVKDYCFRQSRKCWQHETLLTDLNKGDDAEIDLDQLSISDTPSEDKSFTSCLAEQVYSLIIESQIPLTESQRSTLLLLAESYNVTETARALGVSHQYVSSLRASALERCRNYLEID